MVEAAVHNFFKVVQKRNNGFPLCYINDLWDECKVRLKIMLSYYKLLLLRMCKNTGIWRYLDFRNRNYS